MGCDIHEYVEHKVNGVWKLVPASKGPLDYFDNFIKDGDKDKGKHNWNLPRNYSFFGLMAGVRSETFNPLQPRRGIPDDISAGVAKQWKDWDGDGHSPSYYTLTELLDFKTKNSTAVSYLSMKEYKNCKTLGYPDDWNGYPPYNGKEISNNEMDRIINLLAFWDGVNYYTETIWEHPNRLICDHFWDNMIPAMQKLDSNTDNVRFVFWFDN